MKIQVEELSPIERKLSIEVEPAVVTQELNQAYATLSRQVKIAGFRPGKVPRRILEQRFKDEVEGDVIRRLVERAYLEAIREHQVDAVSHPRVTNEALRPDVPFRFQARVDVKPKVQAKEYRELPLKKVEKIVDDARVDQQLEKMRHSMSRLEPVEGREIAQAGDFAQVDYHATQGGKEFPGSRAENVTVQVVPGELVESKIAALEGTRVGETKELDYAFPKDYSVEEVRGKVGNFRIRLKALKVEVVPELNEDFAREMQGGETVDALRAKVRGDLERSTRQEIAAEERAQIVKLLIERNPFEVPQGMVDRAVEMMLEGSIRSMARGGIDPRKLGLDFEQLRDELKPRALNEVKGVLLLESVAEQESLLVSEAEIEKKVEEIATETGQPLSKVRKFFKDPDERRSLSRRIQEEKTVEFLKVRGKYL